MQISAFIITFNEAKNLPRCLASLQGLVDEVVVVDSESQDQTLDIAERAGARVFTRPWAGFVAQKNFAAGQCRYPWVLSIDADEEVSPELKRALLEIKPRLGPPAEGAAFAYAMPRCVFYEGRWIRHGDWYPDYVTRLYFKEACTFKGGEVHESLHYPGELARLKGDLHHYSFVDKADHLERLRKYSALWAKGKFAAGKKAGFFAPWSRSAFRFVRGFLLRRGFMEGKVGLQIAAYCAYDVWLKYRLLQKLNRKGS